MMKSPESPFPMRSASGFFFASRCFLSAAFCLLAAPPALSEDWALAFQDDFDRDALGTNWLVLRGDWHINKERQLQIQRQWASHSFIASTVPLRGRNVKVEFDLVIQADQAGRFGAAIQAGALGWGGGGIDDRVGVEFVGVPKDKLSESKDGLPASLNLELGATHRIAIVLADGRFEVQADGVTVQSGEVAQGRSLVNSGLQFSACPGGRVDNLRVFTRPMAKPLPVLNAASPEESARATVYAEKFLDPKKPDCGIQAAIASLPPGGGVVILPKGTHLLRRFLDVPSHATLAGQGPETVLKAIDVTAAAVESCASKDGVHTAVVKGPHDFQPGDAFAYETSWGHPINAKAPGQKGQPHALAGGDIPQNRLLVLAVEGNTLTVNAPPPGGKAAKVIHFFPLVCSYESEFAEVKDMTLAGPEQNPGGGSGTFCTNPVTFGVTSHPRFTRLNIRGFPADGISAQGCDDGRAFDNTVSGTKQGFHPGTCTLRFMAARNYAVDNAVTGLYFCWYNSNGIYHRNFLKNFTGYPDAGDVFNTLAFNRLTETMGVTVGYNGCLFGNRMPGLWLFGDAGKGKPNPESVLGPGGRSYGNPPRYFTIACNRLDSLAAYRFVRGNVLADNVNAEGKPTPIRHLVTATTEDTNPEKDRNVLAETSGVAPLAGLPEPISRTGPVPPPALPEPVLDGAKFYDPKAPDCGFQAALDELAKAGGTLRLPGGRYALAQALRVPSNVTLAGCGTGTILLAAGEAGGAAIVEGATGATLREFAVEGNWGREAKRVAPAVALIGAARANLIALDIRGWDGDAIRAESGCKEIGIGDCRVFQCAGTGYAMREVAGLTIETSSAVQCGAGFRVEGCAGARLFGDIAGLSADAGYAIASDGALVSGCNAHNNLRDGFLVDKCAGAIVAGNTASANNQAGGAFAGIRVGAGAREARVVYNNCGDEQLRATQGAGIREDKGASKSEIRCNSTATLCTRRGREKDPSLVTEGADTTVGLNWTETVIPSNDSIEAIEWLKEHPKSK